MKTLPLHSRLLILIVVLCSSITSLRSAHLVGGELYYKCLGGNSYEITLKVYRDCNGTGAPFDSYAPVGIFEGGTGILDTLINIPLPGFRRVPINSVSNCLVVPSSLCLQEAIYVDTVTLLPSTTGYDIVYQRCCRNPTIINITTPGSMGSTYHSFIPPTDTFCNSSPSFNNFPPVVLCINDPLSFDHSATDLDGDSLVYEFVTPYHGGSRTNPAPNPTPPPFTTINWAAGFSTMNQVTSLPGLSLNSQTGLLTGTPTALGQYVVGIAVKEYRNGVYVSETRRDFQFNILNCVKTISSIIDPGVICNSYTVNFNNNSINATTYLWDFGDLTTLADTSTQFTPQYTYPDTGVYYVRLIVDPYSPICADTSIIELRVYPILEPYFDKPDNVCFDGHSFNFNAGGKYFPTTQIDWDFGPTSSVTTSSNPTVPNVTYNSEGVKYISLRYQDYGCDTTFVDSVEIYKEVEADFTVNLTDVCIGDSIPVEFVNLSAPGLNYLWQFGDGTMSTAQNPFHIYTSVGTYTLGLIVSDAHCADTMILNSQLTILPSPVANFSPSVAIIPVYDPTINFFNTSMGESESNFKNGIGGVSSPFKEETYTYQEEGYYYPSLVVKNLQGCYDTLVGEIYVQPEVYVPNAFTPNNDGKNDVFLPSVHSSVRYELFIFNRWGEVIFETTDPSQGWDGKNNQGEFLKTEVYSYRITYEDPSGLYKELVGHINLIR